MIETLPSPPLRLLIVDDHEIVREGLKRILEAAPQRWVVAEAGGGFDALEMLRRARVDVAIVDISMPGMSGIELLRRIRAEFPAVRVLMLSMHAEEQYALRAFKGGAHGYVTKESAARELVSAVNKVAGGGAYVSNNLAEQLVLQMSGAVPAPRHAELSDREIEVLRRLVAGQRPTDIAEDLHLSIKTVSTHKARLQEKLQLHSMAALVRYGIAHGFVEDDALTAQPPGAGGQRL